MTLSAMLPGRHVQLLMIASVTFITANNSLFGGCVFALSPLGYDAGRLHSMAHNALFMFEFAGNGRNGRIIVVRVIPSDNR